MKAVNVLLCLGLTSLSVAHPVEVEEESIDDITDEVVRRSFYDDKTPDDSALAKRAPPKFGETGPKAGDASGTRNPFGVNPMLYNSYSGVGNQYGYGYDPYSHGGLGHGNPMNMNPMAHSEETNVGPMPDPAHSIPANGHSEGLPPPNHRVQIPFGVKYNPYTYLGGYDQPGIEWHVLPKRSNFHLIMTRPWVANAGPKFHQAAQVMFIAYKDKDYLGRPQPPQATLSLSIVRYYDQATGIPCIYIWNTIKYKLEKDECSWNYGNELNGNSITAKLIGMAIIDNIKTFSMRTLMLPFVPFRDVYGKRPPRS